MRDHELEQHLSQIATQWTMLYQAHRGAHAEAMAARQLLMQRYCGAVFRYLLRAVRDVALAEDLTQEFALRFIQGRFSEADPGRGKFRNYVKSSLFRLVQDHYRDAGRGPRWVPMDHDQPEPAVLDVAAEEAAFRDSWRQELLAHAWKGLQQVEAETGQPYHLVMRLRLDEPDLSSAQIATRLEGQLGKPFTAVGVRQLLHRGRERFAELLLADIRETLEDAPRERVHEELADLNLLKYCKDILDRKHGD
ncbi:MAG: sigma-70 family RNA polymerase sigma factor [Gemmataceae bacterium]